MRVGFRLVGGRLWTGGVHYLLNLFRVLHDYERSRIEPVLFVGEGTCLTDLESMRKVLAEPIVHSPDFKPDRNYQRLVQSLVWGKDGAAGKLFQSKNIQAVFEAAVYYGWRFPIPAVAWIPDFQHRRLPGMFSFWEFWKRDLGLRAQIASGRPVMVSSECAKKDCEAFYPRSHGRVSVVPFAVLYPEELPGMNFEELKHRYDLPEAFFFLPNQFWKHKNHRLVIETLKIFKTRGKNSVVAASGLPFDPRHPRHFEELQEAVREYGLAENFRFLGMIPYPELLGLMRACLAVLNPSFSEGWSTTVEEAKSLGVPLLLSDIPVHHEQAEASAIYFDPRSPISLMKAMETALECFEPGPRWKEEEAAALAARRRCRLFARRFADFIQAARHL